MSSYQISRNAGRGRIHSLPEMVMSTLIQNSNHLYEVATACLAKDSKVHYLILSSDLRDVNKMRNVFV
jgi:hypothetical protein